MDSGSDIIDALMSLIHVDTTPTILWVTFKRISYVFSFTIMLMPVVSHYKAGCVEVLLILEFINSIVRRIAVHNSVFILQPVKCNVLSISHACN